MKSMDVKRIGSIATGAVMLGAALAGPVSAGMDTTGLDKGFFYDENFNPIVQIVVGEKAQAGGPGDFVTAGNIAATIGNLAYMTKTTGVEFTPTGKVVVSNIARAATGDYAQDLDTKITEAHTDFYDADDGLHFDGDKSYERGDFTVYNVACEQQTREEAALLMEGDYRNIHCLFCQTLCLEALENPSHEMKEKIYVDSSKIRYYEEGINDDDTEDLKMAIDKDAIKYTVETGYIPMKRLTKSAGGTANDYIDFEYRGKMILFGDEYYVRDIDGADTIYLSKGKVLDDVTSEGFTAEYKGYKFKIDHLIYSAEYQVAGILLDVEKPDGTVVQTQISKMANGVVDDLEIAGTYAEESAALSTASIIVYDTTTNVVLKDGEDLELGGKVWEDWRVEFNVVDSCKNAGADPDFDPNGPDCDISEYDEIDSSTTDALLQQITVTYKHKLDGVEALEKDESLEFPGGKFKLTFKGYMTNNYLPSTCSGAGEGNIVIERGDVNWGIKVSLTGKDGNRYNDVRLDEGPFSKNELFMINGVIYKYLKYESKANSKGKADDQVVVTLDPVISGSREKITLSRYCDPENKQGTTELCDPATSDVLCDCDMVDYDGDGNADSEITLRSLALTDALKDDNPEKVENDDDDINVDIDDLFIIAGTDPDNPFGITMLFDDSNAITFTDDLYLTVNPAMVGTFSDFDVDEHGLSLWVEKEEGVDASLNYEDESPATYDSGKDKNNDGNDEDILVVLRNDKGEQVYIDLCDRGYDENDDYNYDNNVMLSGVNITLDSDEDSLLITPLGYDQYTIDWGTDNRIDSVELCHPKDDVDATYFIGTEEQESRVKTTIVKEDVGTEKTAGCCTFTVDEFTVTAGEEAGITQTVVNPVGNIVVSEVGADLDKNLIIVGGPAVNSLCTATADEIAAASEKFIVRKDGKRLIVAGWESDDTTAAGNALIKWLQENIHA